ncbi:MAG: TolC family protein [Legionella sp.]
MNPLRIVVLLLTIVLFTNVVHAEHKETALTLNKFLEKVERYYPQIKIAQIEIAKANGALLEAMGKFDPTINAIINSQPIGGYINNYGEVEVSVPTLYNGLKLFANYRHGQGSWPLYYQNYLTNSGGEYKTGLSFPLMRNRLTDQTRAMIISSAQSILMKKHDADAIKIKIYQDAIKSYWGWIEAGQQVKILQRLVKLAKQRQQGIERQEAHGELSKLAIKENQQQIIQREQTLNQAMIVLEQAAIDLSLYYRDNQGNPQVPSPESIPNSPHPTIYYKNNTVSLAQHPAVQKLNDYIAILHVKQDLAHNDLLPQVDLTAYTSKQNGTKGSAALIPQAAMIGLSYKFPLLQRQARGSLIQAQNELKQLTIEKKFAYEQLNNEYAKILVGIKRWASQVNLLKKELSLALLIQKSEETKFREGDSTLFLVNQREQMTTQVQLNTLHAEIQLEELQARAHFFYSSRISSALGNNKN